MPKHFINIPMTDITENFELFVLVETRDGYEMLQINLDNFED